MILTEGQIEERHRELMWKIVLSCYSLPVAHTIILIIDLEANTIQFYIMHP